MGARQAIGSAMASGVWTNGFLYNLWMKHAPKDEKMTKA